MDLYTVRNELGAGKSIYDLHLRVTFYARVSTGSDGQAHSLRNQIDYYSGFIEKNLNWDYVEGYVDEALSGTSVGKRESFLRMIEDAKSDKFDLVITKEISRFSRNTLDSIRYTRELLAAGAGVLFQSDNINTLMPDAELRLTIMSSIAQDEVRKISERVKFGFKRAIEKGVVLGNNRIWGYRKQNGRLVIDESEAAIVRSIFNMYATENVGIRGICERLGEQGVMNGNGNKFSFSTIKNILVNPKYMGYYCGNKTSKYDYKLNGRKRFDESEWVMYKDEGAVPPIVSEEVWNKANIILKERGAKVLAKGKSGYQNKYVYSGKIVCAEHGTPYYRAAYRCKSGAKEVWQCREYSAKGKAGCMSPAVYTVEIDMAVKELYNETVKNKTDMENDLIRIYSAVCRGPGVRGDIAKAGRCVSEIRQRMDRLLDLSIESRISDAEFDERNRRFNMEIESLEARIAKLEEEERKTRGAVADMDTLRRLIGSELGFDEGFDNRVVDALLDKIEVAGDRNVIDLKIRSKAADGEKKYRITRGKNASVCSAPYI